MGLWLMKSKTDNIWDEYFYRPCVFGQPQRSYCGIMLNFCYMQDAKCKVATEVKTISWATGRASERQHKARVGR